MKVLLINPDFPPSFWSFEGALKLLGVKSFLPPLGLLTVAALLPQEWEFRLIDREFEDVSEDDWAWAEMVVLTGMIVQRSDMLDLIRQGKQRGKTVVVGGPYAMSLPNEVLEAGADFAVLDEGELTIPMFLEALERGETSGTFTANGQKADMTTSPLPRYDLIDVKNYNTMSIQFSRGCPFLCEFCDIITLFGRRPRTKTPAQIRAELDQIYATGWRGGVFMVDDNFIGNRLTVKPMLEEVIDWQREHNFPFTFTTEASVDLAEAPELMKQMRLANFVTVFVGIESPDEESLVHIKKKQNVRGSLIDRVKTINASGLKIMGGFIIGFDGEKSGADKRILEFVEEAQIPIVTVSLLQALPKTALTDRLRAEGRLLEDDADADLNSSSLTNFVPTRPLSELAREQASIYQELYDPKRFIERAFHHNMATKDGIFPTKGMPPSSLPRNSVQVFAFLKVLMNQGVIRSSRVAFWRGLFSLFRHNKPAVKGYISMMGLYEHLYKFKNDVRVEMTSQIAQLSEQDRTRVWPPPPPELTAPTKAGAKAG
ncbi:B12-binding domain-containing radical SAM protein [Shimia abyssi]|uniref:Radical SAM superfamily enzyme YgiQ (UPF0313 family) n=1 Tax=Shimia abyssi TaxID=1662395 RepID=A0A2P8FFP0_9RHOB|nr:B12-binding domain-containing radical SAM protein [Shimia abyssi]PSL20533.1 radical SAM superfamily enzyme YgiQ (UPF0313 family) [Shimia abyssi]